MKITIGDIHARPLWKKYINEDFTEFYFLGDYFDDYENTPTVYQVHNFKEIVEWARKDSRVKLCYGNHDFHYLKGCERERYSGYQYYGRFDIQEVLESASDIMQPVYLTDNILISHAGITKTFMKENNLTHPLDINKRFLENRMLLAHAGFDPYGDSVHDGCLWVRPNSLFKDKIEGYKQIVGHTHTDEIYTQNDITFCDNMNKNIYKFS